MSIPKTRKELLEQLVPAWDKLEMELEAAGLGIGDLSCVDDWTVKELLAVRVWWTGAVIDWVVAWRRGEDPILPNVGYGWSETPSLNADIVYDARDVDFAQIVRKLKVNYYRIISTIDDLSDAELVDVGHFKQAGRYPICRWISINTTRQYLTARTHIRKAVRQANG